MERVKIMPSPTPFFTSLGCPKTSCSHEAAQQQRAAVPVVALEASTTLRELVFWARGTRKRDSCGQRVWEESLLHFSDLSLIASSQGRPNCERVKGAKTLKKTPALQPEDWEQGTGECERNSREERARNLLILCMHQNKSQVYSQAAHKKQIQRSIGLENLTDIINTTHRMWDRTCTLIFKILLA